jgi:hypothetical protein
MASGDYSAQRDMTRRVFSASSLEIKKGHKFSLFVLFFNKFYPLENHNMGTEIVNKI